MISKEHTAEIRKHIDHLYPRLKGFREDLHRHPELSWKEFRTTQKIEVMLKQHGLKNFNKPLETGGYIDFVYGDKLPILLLRADIDALPIQDKKRKRHASQNKGVCHACGHDVHTSIILGLALLISRMKLTLPFNLRFVFQPAEETIPNGAEKMIEAGILEGVKHAIAIHVEPRLEFGTVALTPGWVNMQSVRLEVLLSGKGGHSAYPHKAADLIWIASRLIQDSYQMIYREFDLLKTPLIVSFTEIEAGQGYNIFPSRLRLAGTLRTADSEAKDRFYRKLKILTNSLENETGAAVKVSVIEGAPPVLNDTGLITRLQERATDVIGARGVIKKIVTDFRSPGGDDFGNYSQRLPSALIRFGFAKKGYNSLLHTDTFDVPPELIKTAIAFLAHQIHGIEL